MPFFMHTLGEIYQSQPAFSEDSHTRLISISALPLPEGKALPAPRLRIGLRLRSVYYSRKAIPTVSRIHASFDKK
jgi:hypothetical protein